MNEIVSTGYSYPLAVVSNGAVTGNEFTDPNNILLSDDEFAQSQPGAGVASDIIIGNFDWANGGIPSDAVITGFEIKIIGKRGEQTVPPITVQLYAVDNTSGSDVFYPYISAYSGLTPNNEEHVLGTQNYLFDTTWTGDQANNFKLQLVSNGDIYLDTVLVNVYYYVPTTPTPAPPIPSGCLDCNSPIQVQAMFLELPFLVGDTKFYLKRGSFAYADGTPVQPGDVGDCDGEVVFTFDQDKRKQAGQNFAENAVVDTATGGTWTVLPSGVIEVDIVDITNRGLKFSTPYDHDANLMSDHDANSEVVISNSGRFYLRFVRACQVDIVFSAPVDAEDEGTTVVTAVHTFNFIGQNVQAEQDLVDPQKVNVTVLSNPTNTTPTVEDTSTGTTGAVPAIDLTIAHTIVNANYLRVWISTDDEVITSVTYNGVSMTLVGSETNAPADLKVALYELVNPTVGANDIVVTMAAISNITAGGISFVNVDTSNPTDGVSAGATGNNTAPTDSGTTTVDNTVIQDVVGTISNATTFTQGALWSIQGQVNAADRPGASSTRRVLSPGTVTDIYTIAPSGQWAIILAGVRGISNPTGFVETVTDDGQGLVVVDNTDPVNPVVGFDQVALANDVTFIDALVANNYFTSSLANDNNFITELTSNALFQTEVNNFVSGGGAGILTASLFDDFLSSPTTITSGSSGSPFIMETTSGGIGQLNWLGFSTGSTDQIGEFIEAATNHPGIFRLTGNAGQDEHIQLGSNSGTGELNALDNIVATGNTYTAIVRPVNAATAGDSMLFGIAGSITDGNPIPTNTILVIFNGTTGNLTFNTRAAGAAETTTIGAWAAGTWYKIHIVVNAGNIECYIDDVLEANHTTKPAGGTNGTPYFYAQDTTEFDIDYFGMTYNVTR